MSVIEMYFMGYISVVKQCHEFESSMVLYIVFQCIVWGYMVNHVMNFKDWSFINDYIPCVYRAAAQNVRSRSIPRTHRRSTHMVHTPDPYPFEEIEIHLRSFA